MRAKFQVQKTEERYGNEEVSLFAVYGDSTNAEDNQFSAATPNGTLNMSISNPKAKGFFKEGKKYYLDITEAVD